MKLLRDKEQDTFFNVYTFLFFFPQRTEHIKNLYKFLHTACGEMKSSKATVNSEQQACHWQLNLYQSFKCP